MSGPEEEKKRKREEDRDVYIETKGMDSGEERRDKEKNGVKQKLNESEGMTEISSGITERLAAMVGEK